MPPGVTVHPKTEKVDELDADGMNIGGLNGYISDEIMRSRSSKSELETMWENSLRLYEGVPKQAYRNVPIENAPNLEIPLGAIATDALYASMMNLIFNIAPAITAAEVDEEGTYKEHVKALQRFIDLMIENDLGLRQAADNAVLDTVKLGTGIYYTRWAENKKKTKTETVISSAPEVVAVPLEDFFVPGGMRDDLEKARWCAMRVWLTQNELNYRIREFEWKNDCATPSLDVGRIRTIRERLGRHSGSNERGTHEGELYEVYDVYVRYDIDGDGIDEDLLVTWDYGSRQILKWSFNPYDRRPFSIMRYQARSFMFYGMGVVEMLRSFQEGTTELYNHWIVNSMLANCRFWVGPHGAVPGGKLRIWPNRYLEMSDPSALKAIQMGDTYASAPAALSTTLSLAERRSGVNDLTMPRPSAVLGSRTPGITALSMLEKANERFGPAFDSVRLGTADTVKQGLYRYQERLLAGDKKTEKRIKKMMGEVRGQMVIDLLKDRDFDNAIKVEVTASSVKQNRQVEQQNWMLVLPQILNYYERAFQLINIMAQPNVPDPVRKTATQIFERAGEIIDRALRNFNVKDPQTFILKLEEELTQLGQADQQGLAGISQFISQIAGGGAGGVPTANPLQL